MRDQSEGPDSDLEITGSQLITPRVRRSPSVEYIGEALTPVRHTTWRPNRVSNRASSVVSAPPPGSVPRSPASTPFTPPSPDIMGPAPGRAFIQAVRVSEYFQETAHTNHFPVGQARVTTNDGITPYIVFAVFRSSGNWAFSITCGPPEILGSGKLSLAVPLYLAVVW